MNWVKIKVLCFEKANHKIQYIYRYGDDFSAINIIIFWKRKTAVIALLDWQLAKTRLPISCAKKADLLALCESGVDPKEHHEFFKRLPSSKNTDWFDDGS